MGCQTEGHNHEFRTAENSNALLQPSIKSGHQPNLRNGKVFMQFKDSAAGKPKESIFSTSLQIIGPFIEKQSFNPAALRQHHTLTNVTLAKTMVTYVRCQI